MRVWQRHRIHLTAIFLGVCCVPSCVLPAGIQKAEPGMEHRKSHKSSSVRYRWPQGAHREGTGCAEGRERLHQTQDQFCESLEMNWCFPRRWGAWNIYHALVLQNLKDGRYSSGNRRSWVGIWGAVAPIL